jgi:hypothetical protein
MQRSQSYDIAVMLSNVKETQKQLKLDLWYKLKTNVH